jgi:glycosyltransferase involved in cell wall biosynthesis
MTEESLQLPSSMPGGSPWPLVSIVTPSYKQGQFLEETIRSVLLQGYPNLEYIIIDGGSTDGSVEIIRRYESRLAYWVSEPDGGQSEALNQGFARTSGAILGWLNSDDRFRPGAIASAVTAFAANPQAGVVYGDCIEIDETGKHLRNYKARAFDLRRQLVAQMIPQPAAFFRRTVWEKVGPLRTDLHYTMDRDFWNRTALEFPIVHVSVLLAEMRMHASSKTVSQAVRFTHETEMLYDEFFSRPDLPPELKQLEPEARGVNYFEMGHRYYGMGQMQQARQSFAQAWHVYPFHPNKLMIIPFWLDAVLGTHLAPPIYRMALRLKHGI